MLNEFSGILSFIRALIIILPNLFILIISIYYLIKSGTIDAILMTTGSILNTLCSFFFGIDIYKYLSDFEIVYYAVDLLFFIGLVLFGIGLLILINKNLKK